MKEALSQDTVFLERLSLSGKHGVHDHERAQDQEFLIDISASLDTRPAAASDELQDAVDYGGFRAIAQEVIGGGTCHLIETLADRIAVKLLEDTRLSSVTVAIRKPHIYPDCMPGVSITRQRV
jgi:dihydroneopterin aldolase